MQVCRERLLACYGKCTNVAQMQWGTQSDLPIVVSKLLGSAHAWFGNLWPDTVFILDGCIEERMELASLAPVTATIFAKLGPHMCKFARFVGLSHFGNSMHLNAIHISSIKFISVRFDNL